MRACTGALENRANAHDSRSERTFVSQHMAVNWSSYKRYDWNVYRAASVATGKRLGH